MCDALQEGHKDVIDIPPVALVPCIETDRSMRKWPQMVASDGGLWTHLLKLFHQLHTGLVNDANDRDPSIAAALDGRVLSCAVVCSFPDAAC